MKNKFKKFMIYAVHGIGGVIVCALLIFSGILLASIHIICYLMDKFVCQKYQVVPFSRKG